MLASSLPRRSSNKAAALIIVLAFVVLLTGLSLAYFSRTTTDRQLAHSSYNDTSADLLARSALDIVVGDFKQEIVNGSNPTSISGTTIYVPQNATKMVPVYNPTPADTPAILNLIRRSVRSDGIAGPAVPSRGSAVNSTVDASANGRSISLARWNAHYLVPKLNSSTTDYGTDPITNGFVAPNYWAPDWVIVTRAGPTPFASWNATLADASPTNTSYAIGRYAYAVYDEGGLLDINVAGYPSPAPTPIPELIHDTGRKANLAWADLTAFYPLGGAGTQARDQVNKIVGFRNYATTVWSNVSNLNFTPTPPVINDKVYGFMNYFLGGNYANIGPNGQRTIPAVGFSPGKDFIAVNPMTAPDGRTDQSFITRAEMINYFKSAAINSNTLQFLGTFSREQNKPTLPLTSGWPNPVLLQRFYLGNLDCVQHPVPAGCGGDTSIQNYFGLLWGANNRWQYVGQTGSSLRGAISAPNPTGSPAPDFFQILNYVIPGKPIDKILSLGAMIIDLYDYDQPSPNSQVTTGIEYAPAPAIAWGTEYALTSSGLPLPTPTPTPIAMGTPPIPPPAPTAIAGYTPSIQAFNHLKEYSFQSSGELGYVYNPVTGATLNFKDAYDSGSNPDPALLDFFTYNTAPVRAGTVSLNTRQAAVLSAILKSAVTQNFSIPVGLAQATPAATSIVNATTAQPAQSRADIARLASVIPNTFPFNTEEGRETFARAFSETTQTRTWGLLIDVVAQTGHYGSNAGSGPNTTNPLANFVVEGEKRYWLHIAIDRFDGTIVGQQLEEVTE